MASNNGVALLFGSLSNNTKTNQLTIEVKAAYDILPKNVQDSLLQEDKDLSLLPSVNPLLRLSKRLGMRVVGCSVGNKTLSSVDSTWSSDHILVALHLRNLSIAANEFVVLRYTRYTQSELNGEFITMWCLVLE